MRSFKHWKFNHLKSKHVIHESEDYSGTGRNPITNFDKGNEFFRGYKEEAK